MRWLILACLWIVALVIALVVYRRVRRGRYVLLTGRFSPRLVRMIAVILVMLGAEGDNGAKKAQAFPLHPIGENVNDVPPAKIKNHTITQWLETQVPHYYWTVFKKDLTTYWLGQASPESIGRIKQLIKAYVGYGFFDLIAADMEAFDKKAPAPSVAPKKLIAALDQLEKSGHYDHWANAYLWRKSLDAEAKDERELVVLYGRLYEHARITDSLIAACNQVRPLMQPPRAWMSKAGPRPADMPIIEAYQRNLKDMVDAFAKLYPKTDTGTWARDGLVRLSSVKGSPAPNILRGGKIKGFPEGEQTRVGRLDLIESPKDRAAILEHEWLGRIELPAGRVISVWQLPTFLSNDSSNKLKTAIGEALDGDEKAADRLEKVLPLAHRDLRAALRDAPKTKGSARLRMILSLFDDALMPVLKGTESIELPLGGSRGADGPGGILP